MWPIFIINLDRSPERMAASERLMSEAGLTFERVPACDWRSLSQADIHRYVSCRPPRFAKRPVQPVEVACFLSHLTIWQRIAVGNSPGAFVFEDDFELASRCSEILSLISSRKPDWDMLKLYSNKAKTLTESAPLIGNYRVGNSKKLPMATLAYAITKPAAGRLANMAIPIGRPVDLFLKHWWEHSLCIKVMMPPPVQRRSDHLATSEIDPVRNKMARGNIFSRFYKNTLYQLAFEAKTALNSRWRPRHRRCFDESNRMAPDE